MKTFIGILAVLLIVGGLAYHFAALEIFAALVPKDSGSKLLRSDVPYGPEPRQKLDVYAPDQPGGAWPIVLFVHGGSWQEGNKNPYVFVGRALAAQGFVTLVMNYRLFPEGRYPAFVDDVDLALRWARDNAPSIGGDPSRLFAVGHSAGGYNVAMAALDQRFDTNRPKLSGVVLMAAPLDFLPLDSPVTIKVFGNLSDLPATQPVNHVRADAPPFLILHGSADTTVRPRNSTSLDKTLKAARASSEMKIYDGVSHVGILLAIATPLRKTPVLEDAGRFMRSR